MSPAVNPRATDQSDSRPLAAGAQKKGSIGKRTRARQRRQQHPEQRATQQADLDSLEVAAAAGELAGFALDEAGFCQWSPVSDSYFFRGEQKRLEQTERRGRRLSLLG